MKKMFRYLFLLCSIACTSCNDSAKNDSAAADTSHKEMGPAFDRNKARADLDSHNQKFMNDFKNGDSVALAAHYASNGILFPPNCEAVKGAGILSAWGAAIRMGIKELKIMTDEMEGNDELLAENGRYEMYDANNKMLDKGKFVVVWKKENGEWKIYNDIWNTNMPAK